MKVAVSIPEDVFRDADREARRLGISRSELYAQALRQLLEARRARSVTESYDRAFDDEAVDEPLLEASRRALLRIEW